VKKLPLEIVRGNEAQRLSVDGVQRAGRELVVRRDRDRFARAVGAWSRLRIMAEPRLQRVLTISSFDEMERTRPRLRYWLSRPPAERIAAVEFLRRQVDGGRARLRRVHRMPSGSRRRQVSDLNVHAGSTLP
jgi:hypothetical protein